MTRRDDVGERLEGDGTEDTILDGDGDNTGDAGDGYRSSLWFGTTAAEEFQGQSLDQLLAQKEPDAVEDLVANPTGMTVGVSASWPTREWWRGRFQLPGLAPLVFGHG